MLERKSLLIFVLFISVVSAPLVLDSFYLTLLTQIFIFSTLALSVDLLIGYIGLVPLGHAGIFGTSAYVLAYCLVRLEWSTLPAVLLALVAGVVASALFGSLAVRTRGIYFIMLTLAEGMIVWGVIQRWTSVTGGANGIRNIPRTGFLGSDLTYYYVVLLVFVIGFWILSKIVTSPFGLSCQGIQQLEERMPFLGYNTFLFKFIGFLISGTYASVAGILYTLHNEFISPSSVDLMTSAEAVLMVIVGGAGTLWGGIIGSGLILSIENIVSIFTDRWTLIMGGLYIVTMLFARRGILGLVHRLFGSSEMQS